MLNKLFKSILEPDTAPIVVCDMDDIIVYMNPSAIARYHIEFKRRYYAKQSDLKESPPALIKCVNVGGEMAPKNEVRPIEYEWVKNLFLEAKERNIEFYFHQCGSMFLRDGVNIGKWNLNEQIKRAEEIQFELERIYG